MESGHLAIFSDIEPVAHVPSYRNSFLVNCQSLIFARPFENLQLKMHRLSKNVVFYICGAELTEAHLEHRVELEFVRFADHEESTRCRP